MKQTPEPETFLQLAERVLGEAIAERRFTAWDTASKTMTLEEFAAAQPGVASVYLEDGRADAAHAMPLLSALIDLASAAVLEKAADDLAKEVTWQPDEGIVVTYHHESARAGITEWLRSRAEDHTARIDDDAAADLGVPA